MKIDLLKIGKISTKKDIEKYELNSPIFLDNYLFHYLILTNNLKALKLYKFPFEKENDDKLNGFHLASKYDNFKILKYLLEKYPKLSNTLNSNKENFLHYLSVDTENYKSILENKKINLSNLIQQYSIDKISPLDIVFNSGSYENIINVIKNIKIKYYEYTDTPPFFGIILNSKLNNKERIKILKELHKKDKKSLSYTDLEGNNFLYPLILEDNLELFKFLHNFKQSNLLFDSYSPINTYHIFSVSYSKGIITEEYKFSKYIIDSIIKKHNFNETNKNGDNLAHFIIKSRLLRGKGNYEIEKKILSKYNYWDKLNVDNKSVLEYLTFLDYDKYCKFVKGIKINKEFNLKGIKNKRWNKLINNLEKYSEKDNIKFGINEYSHGNIFQARFTDIAIFSYHLDNKYSNLYLPRSNKKLKNKPKKDIKYPDDLLKFYHNFVWTIVWNNENNYFIHPHLNKSIKKNKDKYDYSFCLLSLRLPNDGLHASLIFYDFKNKIIERFDPYGNTMELDKNMDEILEKELTKGLNFKYYSPNKYFPVAGFQTISDENNKMNQKMGDFGGYCLAWCMWYIEHRLKNKNIDPKNLIRKTLNKLMKLKIKPNEYIRNYANHINKKRVEWLVSKGIPENETSNEILSINYLTKIKVNIIKENEQKI
jgi:hypothetical protein